MSITATTGVESTPSNPLILPLAAATGCAALADWLFFGWNVGISLALFLGALGLVAVAINRVRTPRLTHIIMATIFIAGLLALVEDVNILSVLAGTLATAAFVIVTTARQPASWQRRLFEAATVPLRGPFRLVGDVIGALRHMKQLTPGWLGSLVAWIVPLSIFAVFVALFSSANPLIERQLM